MSNSKLSNESSDLFVHFLTEQLSKSVCSKIVKEFSCIFLVNFFGSTNMEVDSHVKTNMNIIFCYNISNWTIVSNTISRNSNDRSSASWVAAVKTRLHQTGILTPVLLKNKHTCWDILQASAPSARTAAGARGFVKNDDDWSLVATMFLRDQSWSFLWIIRINLSKMSSRSQRTL